MLTVPTWIAAIATVVLATGLILAAWLARSAFDARTRRLDALHELAAKLTEVLELSARNLQLSMEERRRVQACQVFIELDRLGERVAATVHNNSQQPVYDLYVIWQLGTVRVGKPDRAARLLPGHEVCFKRGPEPGAAVEAAEPRALTAFLTFRDTAGVRWTVREDGTLSDISPAPDVR
jgi:hypothetical protein